MKNSSRANNGPGRWDGDVESFFTHICRINSSIILAVEIPGIAILSMEGEAFLFSVPESQSEAFLALIDQGKLTEPSAEEVAVLVDLANRIYHGQVGLVV